MNSKLFLSFNRIGLVSLSLLVIPLQEGISAPPTEEADTPLIDQNPRDAAWREISMYKTVPDLPQDPRLQALWEKMARTHSRPKEKSVLCVGGNRYEKTLWENGRATRSWLIDGVLVFEPLNLKPGNYLVARLANDEFFRNSELFDLFLWISHKNFRKVESINGSGSQDNRGGQKALVYAESFTPPPEAGFKPNPAAPSGGPDRKPIRKAVVLQQTRLPLAYEDELLSRKYIYEKSPATSLPVPPEVRKLIDESLSAGSKAAR